MKEHQQRQEAVQRYISGEKVAVIARYLGRSRKWVHHWINRYNQDPDGERWFEDESKAPKKTNRTLSEQAESDILLIRNDLAKEKMAQIGAISIQYEFKRRGIKLVPDVWTINRVIAKHGLNKQTTFVKTPKEYPELYLNTHQMDLVGPRYIKGDGRFYSINFIDIGTHTCFVRAVRTKSADGIVEAIASFWNQKGIHDALQMDNELSFRGSNRHPRSFGRVVRFALSQGVTPVFIPLKEPWRNGIIEKFNHTYQKRFVRAYHFSNFDDLVVQEKSFMDFHNSNHRYSSQGHKTADEMNRQALPAIYYSGQVHLQKHIPLTDGCVYFVRFIRSDLTLSLLNEKFKVPTELKYSYVVAEININNQSLTIRQDGDIKTIFPYHMPVDW